MDLVRQCYYFKLEGFVRGMGWPMIAKVHKMVWDEANNFHQVPDQFKCIEVFRNSIRYQEALQSYFVKRVYGLPQFTPNYIDYLETVRDP